MRMRVRAGTTETLAGDFGYALVGVGAIGGDRVTVKVGANLDGRTLTRSETLDLDGEVSIEIELVEL